MLPSSHSIITLSIPYDNTLVVKISLFVNKLDFLGIVLNFIVWQLMITMKRSQNLTEMLENYNVTNVRFTVFPTNS